MPFLGGYVWLFLVRLSAAARGAAPSMGREKLQMGNVSHL